MTLYGYKRADGKVGIRNHVIVLPSSVCATQTAHKIAAAVPEAVVILNQHGCGQIGEDYEITKRTLSGFGKNPNVCAVLVVGLGCENVKPHELSDEIKKTGKRVETVVIQENGGTPKTIAKGIELLSSMIMEASQMQKTKIDISDIILAMECGGSDTTSGLIANPAIGVACDRLIEEGGTAILSETTEFIGAEHIFARRAVNEKVKADLLAIVEKTEKNIRRAGVDIRGSQPSPGNIEGGLSSIEEKSLGCIHKSGTKPLQGVLQYAQEIKGKGLYVMDTPGQDIESITGMVAGGAQIVVFTTGRGSPAGCPIAPVIKLTGNPKTYRNMVDNIDINGGKVIEEGKSVSEIGQEIFDEILMVINGKQTKAEALGHHEFGILKISSTL